MTRVNIRLNIHDFGKFSFTEDRRHMENEKEEENTLVAYVFPSSTVSVSQFSNFIEE